MFLENFKKFFDKDYLGYQLEISKKELKILFKWSIPLIISNLLNNVSYILVNLAFVGNHSEDELAGVALSNTWTYCTMSFGTGLANAMDTLVSQSFGASNMRMVGLTLQRASIISTISFIVITPLWCITDYFLKGVGQNETASNVALQYALFLLPGLWFYLQTNCLQKYLQCQGVMWPSILVGFLMNALNVLFNFLFVRMGYGDFTYKGAALATSLARIISFFLMLGVIKLWKLHEETWFGWDRECLSPRGLLEYLKIGGPASIQHASEALGFEVLTILAGILGPGNLPVDAHSVTYNFTMLTYQFPSGISIATSVRVGQLLGSKNEAMAKRVSWMAFVIALVFMGIIAIIQYTCRNVIGYIYSNNQEVIEMVSHIIKIAAIFQIADGGQTIFQGVVRGMGRVTTGAICNFIAFYVISIPMSAILAFPVGVGVEGLWWGLCIGLVSICLILMVIILKVDWTSEVDKAVERTKSSHFTKEDIEMAMRVENETDITSSGTTVVDTGVTTIKVSSDSGVAYEQYDDSRDNQYDKEDNVKNIENSDDDIEDLKKQPSQQKQLNASGGSINKNKINKINNNSENNNNNNNRYSYNNRGSSHNNFRTSSNNNFRTSSNNNFRTSSNNNLRATTNVDNRTVSSPDFRSDEPDQVAVNRCHPQ